MSQTVTISEEDAKAILEILVIHCLPDGTQNEETMRVKNVLSEELRKKQGERAMNAFSAYLGNGLCALDGLLPLEVRSEIHDLQGRQIELFRKHVR